MTLMQLHKAQNAVLGEDILAEVWGTPHTSTNLYLKGIKSDIDTYHIAMYIDSHIIYNIGGMPYP